MTAILKIGDLARQTGCPVETIRYYEHEGLVAPPARSQGNYRLYHEGHIERLTFIRHCRTLSMTIAEIKVLLRFHDAPDENCDEVNELLGAHIAEVVKRISELRRLKETLCSLQRQCGKSRQAKDCGILKGLSAGYRARAVPSRRTSRSRDLKSDS